MGYYGQLVLKQEAQKMRGKGISYNKIVSKLHIPKSTVSDWCKDVKLTEKQINKLYAAKKQGAIKGSFIAAKRKQDKRIFQTREMFKKGFQEIGKLTKRERLVIGIALYAAEGTKIDKGCCLSNSDPKVIKFMVHWFQEFGNVSKEKFRGAIWLHEGLNEAKAKQFWSEVTDIPLSQFYKTYRAKDKKFSKKIRKNIHEYGIFSFYVNDTNLLRKIMGWIGGILV